MYILINKYIKKGTPLCAPVSCGQWMMKIDVGFPYMIHRDRASTLITSPQFFSGS